MNCPSCGGANTLATGSCEHCGKSLADAQPHSLLQSIADSNEKNAKAAQEKSAAAGFFVGFALFHVVATFSSGLKVESGFNYYRMVCAAACGGVGAAIGRWIARPK
jgi:uncharacterized membrane protein YvbJ